MELWPASIIHEETREGQSSYGPSGMTAAKSGNLAHG